jgi:hypothetical protein
MTQTTTIGRAVAFMVATAAFLSVVCHGAYAIDTCRGTYSASLIHPIPSPNVVQYESETNDPAALTELGAHFLEGLRRGGISTTGQPRTRLYVVTIVTPPSGTSSGPEDQSAGSASLTMTATLRNIQTAETIWVGSLSCTVLTDDQDRVAETIGEILGRAVGKDFSSQQF